MAWADFSFLPVLPVVLLTLSPLLPFEGAVFTKVSLSFCTQRNPSPFLNTGGLFWGNAHVTVKYQIFLSGEIPEDLGYSCGVCLQ